MNLEATDNKKNKNYFCSYTLNKKLMYTFRNFMTWARSSSITFRMIRRTLFVYNGKRHFPLYIHDLMKYYKLGEFVFTRQLGLHKLKTEKIVKKVKKKK